MEHLELQKRLDSIKERIARSCDCSGRLEDTVRLVAVTKTQPPETVQALIDLGVRDIGENRVQEVLDKKPGLKGEFRMHFIGRLQTNKVARLLPFVQMIQSVDRVRLVDFIARYLPDGALLSVLVEVNTSGEAAKGGCAPDGCREIIERILSGGRRMVPTGFMTVGPLSGGEKATRASFALLRTIAEKNSDLLPDPELSMGMSDDFEWAIREGSTIVRIGTLLVGERRGNV